MKCKTLEKRKSKRSYLSWLVKVRDYSRTLLHDAEIIDVSCEGMKIRTRAEAPQQSFAIVVRIPVVDSHEESMPVLTMVKWIQKENDGTYLLGLKYMV